MNHPLFRIGTLALWAACGSAAIASDSNAPLASTSYNSTEIVFEVLDLGQQHELRVRCGAGEALSQRFAAGEDPWFVPLDSEGYLLADSACTYELRPVSKVADRSAGVAPSLVQRGSFDIQGGEIVGPKGPGAVNDGEEW